MKNSRIAFFEGGTVAGPERTLPERFLLIRFGRNLYTKNGERGEFEFTPEDADKVIDDFTARGRDLVIDYEHQSLSGEKAPAAGWISRLEKTAEGILAEVKYWTREAQEFLLQGQYRYFSPTLYFSRSGKRVTAIHSAALTNHPAMHGIPALVADDLTVSAPGDASETAAATTPETQTQPKEEKNMNSLLVQLGLEAFRDADEEKQQEAVGQRIAALTETERLLHDFLETRGLHDLDEIAGKLDRCQALETEQAVRQAFADGKLTGSMRNWAEKFAASDPAAFAEWCQAAPRIVPDNQDTVPAALTGPAVSFAPGSEEARILRLLGLTDKQPKTKGDC